MKLSACVITKNEEDNLAICLESVQKIADEIIVVDTGSTDHTIAIAKQFKAIVYSYIWQDDFAATKNFAIEKATGDWIIFLDADEYFAPEIVGNVKDVVVKHAKECDAYLLKMINIDVDDNDKQLDNFFATRIFKNSKELRFFGKVHEELRFVNGKRKALYQVDEKEIVLYHTGYSTKRMQQKCKRNLKILLEELKENPKNINLYRYLADVYHGLQEYENAVKYAKLDIETGKKEISYASRSYRIVNHSLVQINAPKSEIEEYLIKSIEAFPKLPDFYVEYALFNYNSQKYEVAFTLLTKAVTLHENYHDIETSLFRMKIPITYLMFGLLYQQKNDFSQAIDYYEKTLKLDLYYPEAFTALFQLIQQQEAVFVIAFLNNLYDCKNKKDLEFLVNQIGFIKKDKVYFYYYNKLNLLRKGAEKEVYTYEQLRQIIFLTLSLLLTGDQNKVKQVEAVLPVNYQTIIYRYMKMSDAKLTEADFEVYKNILLELFLTNEGTVLSNYVALSRDFSQEKILEIAQIIQEKNYFLQAFVLYEFILNSKEEISLVNVYYQAGFCAYKMRDYVHVVKYFEQALKLGYQENDLKEILAWSVEKS
jgi:glycosyltransferase involved in cell wall biosynthesis